MSEEITCRVADTRLTTLSLALKIFGSKDLQKTRGMIDMMYYEGQYGEIVNALMELCASEGLAPEDRLETLKRFLDHRRAVTQYQVGLLRIENS